MSDQFNWSIIKGQISAFYGENKKAMNIAGISVIAVLALSLGWTKYWLPSREKAAGEQLARLQHYFGVDSFEVVLKGIKGKKMATAPQIADKYFGTNKGREAALMAAEAYLQTGKFEKALEYFDKVSPDDHLLSSAVLFGKGTCYAELGKIEKAASYYEKAAKTADNEYAAQFYKEAGKHYELANELKSALRCYEEIKSKYSTTPEGSDIDKYITKVKALLGEYN